MSRKITPTGRARKGTVTVAVQEGYLRLRFPRTLFKEKRKVLALGLPDTPENRERALRLAERANLDIEMGEFDWTLNRYRDRHQKQPPRPPEFDPITITSLWQQYLKYKTPHLKPRTLDKLRILGRHIERCPIQSFDSLAIRTHLLSVTTTGQVKQCLMYLSAACRWGIKHKRIGDDPFEGMHNDLPPYNWQVNSLPNAFLAQEKEDIIAAFERSNYSHYTPFVKFLLLTGCRPSEAIGLLWGKVTPDNSRILFDSSLVQIGNGQRVRSQGSKNNKSRWFPCSDKLQQLLQSHKPANASAEDLVFPSPKGKSINYQNFCRRAWAEIVPAIVNRKTTPYSCRDTFISEQVAKGINPAVVARWCDNSTRQIEQKYLDNKLLDHIKPID